MRLSPDPHRAAIQRNCIASRKWWMSAARPYKRPWVSLGRYARDSEVWRYIAMARRASRSAWQINRSSNQ